MPRQARLHALPHFVMGDPAVSSPCLKGHCDRESVSSSGFQLASECGVRCRRCEASRRRGQLRVLARPLVRRSDVLSRSPLTKRNPAGRLHNRVT